MSPRPPHSPMGVPHKKIKVNKNTDIVYLTNADIEFYKTVGNLLGGKAKDYDGRINLFRMFPINEKTRYISVRDDDENELGIIEDMSALSAEKQELMNEELNRRYFIPDITKVIDAKQEFGTFFMHVETTAGERKFSMRDLSNNIIRVKDNGIILVDVSGSRYAMKNPKDTAGKAMKFLDIWL